MSNLVQDTFWPAWWCMSAMLALGRMRQEDCHNLKASWACIVRHCLKKNWNKRKILSAFPFYLSFLFFVSRGIRKCAMACIFLNTPLVLQPRLWSIFINVPCALERNALCLSRVFHKFWLCPVSGSASLSPTYPCWLSACLLHQMLKKNLEMPTYSGRVCYFSVVLCVFGSCAGSLCPMD